MSHQPTEASTPSPSKRTRKSGASRIADLVEQMLLEVKALPYEERRQFDRLLVQHMDQTVNDWRLHMLGFLKELKKQ